MFPKNALSGASLALVAILCVPLTGRAADKTVLRPTFDFQQGWDSNIFNESGGDETSLVTRFIPALARLGVNVVGRSTWEESTLSGIDSGARGDFERMLTPRLSFFGNGLFEQHSGYEELRDDDVPPGTPPGLPGEVILAEQPRWQRNQLGLGLRYFLTSRTALRISAGAGRVNYERVSSSLSGDPSNPIDSPAGEYRDRGLWNARVGLQHQLTERDEIGLNADWDDTSYQDLGAGSNKSSILNAELAWNRNWTPLWSTSFSIGARVIDATQDDIPQGGGVGYIAFCTIFGIPFECPQQHLVPLDSRSFSGTGTGLIGSIAIKRVFERSLLRLAYDRDTRSTGGSGRTNFDIDSFSLAFTHRLAERVTLSLSGNYSLYGSVTDEIPSYGASVTPSLAEPGVVTTSCQYGGRAEIVGEFQHPQFPSQMIPIYQCFGGSAQEDRTYSSLIARLDWRLRKQLNAYLVTRWYHSTTDQRLGSGVDIQTDDLDKFTIGLGFRYAWDVDL